MVETLEEISLKFQQAAEFVEEHGLEVQKEVEYVGGVVPLDTPHTSAGNIFTEIEDMITSLINHNPEWGKAIVEVEEEDEEYMKEYNRIMEGLKE